MTSLTRPDCDRSRDFASAAGSPPHVPPGDERTLELAGELAKSDPAVLEHGANVARLALRLAPAVGIEPGRHRMLYRAALLHDIGKCYIPREILDKPAELLPHERRLVEGHSETGAGILAAAGLLAEATIVRHHHERWDGAGYPDRVPGDAIPVESRLIHVADVYDAMTSTRAYRAAMPRGEALAEIRRAAGTQLDPACVEALLATARFVRTA